MLPKGLHLDAIKDTSLRSEAHRKELSMRGTESFAIFPTRLRLQISGTGNEHCWRRRQTEVPGWNVRGWKALENPDLKRHQAVFSHSTGRARSVLQAQEQAPWHAALAIARCSSGDSCGLAKPRNGASAKHRPPVWRELPEGLESRTLDPGVWDAGSKKLIASALQA